MSKLIDVFAREFKVQLDILLLLGKPVDGPLANLFDILNHIQSYFALVGGRGRHVIGLSVYRLELYRKRRKFSTGERLVYKR